MNEHIYSPVEEKWNTLTHGIGAGLSIIGMILLLLKASNTQHIWDDFSFAIYGISLVVLYAVSTAYHAITSTRWKKVFRIADHIAIFLLIAGTYTPIMLLGVGKTAGSYVFAAVWTLAFLGILFKLIFTGRYNILSVIVYLAMGWLAVIIYHDLMESLSVPALFLILIGGLFYSGGTLFYLWEKIPHHHAYWHVMVLLGSFFHFLAIYYFI